MYQYPYGNAQQLNLDWLLSKIQELEAGSGGGADLEEVANALVSASFDSGVSYRRYDYCFYNGKLYRALNDNIGAFNPSDWMEVTLGADIPVLTRLVNADSALITTLQNQLQNLGSDEVANESTVTGTTVSDALGNLNGAITANTSTGISSLSELTTKSTFFNASADLAVGSTGVTIPRYSRGVYITSGSDIGVILAVSIQGDYYYASKSTTWDYATSSKQIEEIVATSQKDNTAPRTLYVGNLIIVNDQLLRVTTKIENGDTITINSNAVATTVEKEITRPYISERIYTNANAIPYNTEITLTRSIFDFKRICFVTYNNNIGWQYRGYLEMNPKVIESGVGSFPVVFNTTIGYLQVQQSSNGTKLGFVSGTPTTLYVTDIYGYI